MKVYNEAGKCANADKEQIPIMLEAGWSLKKPEAKPEIKKDVAPDKAKDEPVVDEPKADEPKAEKTPEETPSVKKKVKKVRKIPKK